MTEQLNQTVLNEMDDHGITLKIPCSTSNLGPGFDCLGAALDRYLTLDVSPAEQEFSLEYRPGPQPDVSPENDLIVTTLKQVLEEHNAPLPNLHLDVDSDIPTGGGLGSSAAAIAGGAALGQLLVSGSVSRQELFERGYRIEGHPDNIAPTVFGGVTVAYLTGENSDRPNAVRIATSLPDLYLVRPDIRIQTEEARQRLPDELPHRDAVFNLTRTGLLVHALTNDHPELLSDAMQDRIHQPYRAELLPGGTEILQAGRDAGALGVWISGAGPTLGCFVRDGNEAPARAMVEVLEHHGATAEFGPANLCSSGLSISKEETGTA